MLNKPRNILAGPMALSTIPAARKTHGSANALLRYGKTPHKEIITVNTGTPAAEISVNPGEQNQIYQGNINLLFTIEATKDILCCNYTEDMNEVGVGFTDGIVRAYDCNTGTCTHTLVDNECRNYPGPVTAIKHRPVSKAHPVSEMLLCSYVNGCIKNWKYKYGQCLYTIREKRQTLGLCYHPRFTKFISYGDDAIINLYDEEALTQERSFYSSELAGIMDGHTSRIFASAFNPKSNHEFVSGGWDNSVMCWDDRQPHATRHFFNIHICGEGLDFTKTGKEILTCSWQESNNLQLWDYGSCKLISTIIPDKHPSKYYCGKFVPGTNYIVCGSSDGNILRVVDMKMEMTECSVRNNTGGVYGFDFGKVRRKGKRNNDIPTIADIPRVVYVSGKKLTQIDFG